MRWKSKTTGEVRYRRRFTWFPTKDAENEWRWLEKVIVKEYFVDGSHYILPWGRWIVEEFVNENNITR
jgi:hypothetical protein